MTKKPRDAARPTPDDALRKAFKAIEAEPTPKSLSDHVERLVGPTRRPDRRS